MEVSVGPSNLTIHYDDRFLVCDQDSRMSRRRGQGLFVADTRFASGFRLRVEGVAPILLNSAQIRPYSARFEFTNPDLDTASGIVPSGALHLRLDRVIGQGIHEDYDLVNYGAQAVQVVLETSIECDFADLFDVRDGRFPRRGSLQTEWDVGSRSLTTRYRNGSFSRTLTVRVDQAQSAPEFANGGISFRIALEPGASWHTCLLWVPSIDDTIPVFTSRCHNVVGEETLHEQFHTEWSGHAATFLPANTDVAPIVRRSVDDLASLRLREHDDAARIPDGEFDDVYWVPAAGVPWFVTLFGRDALVVSLQTLALSQRLALGTLRALAAFQGEEYDDERDMQPGKIHHELRRGELAALHLIPHTPYYGTHDATPLFVLTAAQAWRWSGDQAALDAVRPHVERALAWIDDDGDIDGDGLQEYRTRSSRGYYNQGWKDSGDAIVTATGELAELPIALCELQGNVVAARRAWADVLERAYGERSAAVRQRGEADRLAELIEARFWWESEGTYYLGLDGRKAPIESVASNPGHLLWAGAVDGGRGAAVASRLLAEDMWTGWGIRTLSDRHPSYAPFSYQLGSVWPHDCSIAAAGFRRYGLDEEAHRVALRDLRGGRPIPGRSATRALRRPPAGAGGIPRAVPGRKRSTSLGRRCGGAAGHDAAGARARRGRADARRSAVAACLATGAACRGSAGRCRPRRSGRGAGYGGRAPCRDRRRQW
ncbi:MAG: amylo-alpha-1,6-glucosidase [Acidimicrobiia bacterium]|nr:amylo-alpha-1,6-glucosidase [Acidimicrobiia bacterium]